MKHIVSALILVLAAVSAQAQDSVKTATTNVYVDTQPRRVLPRNFYTIRAGLWFPKDWEKSFTYNGVTPDETKSTIDQSQAIGLDFHYRNGLGWPLALDFTFSGWYSTYDYKYSDMTAENALEVNSWVAIFPIDVGLSFDPFPTESPFHAYAMVGAGGALGLTGRDMTANGQKQTDDDAYGHFDWYLGAGADFLFSESFGISAGLKYHFLEFQKPMYTEQKDFTGLQAMLGIVVSH
jgi:opacity protein-like surface antigen